MKITEEELAKLFEENPSLARVNRKPLASPRKRLKMDFVKPQPRPVMMEKDFLSQILDLAHLYHWRVAHFRPAQTKYGWRTAVQADGAGFPDLVLVRPPKCLIVELKSQHGKLSSEQERWLRELSGCHGICACVWRPSQFDEIESILK